VARNPFEIFGLTPDLVGELSEKELFSVLKAMYRSLQKTFHPDSGRKSRRSGDRSAELNLAFEALDLEKNQPSFRRHKKEYLLTRPAAARQSLLALRSQLRSQAQAEERLADGFWNYLARSAAPGESFYEGAGPPPAVTARGVLLGLQDVAVKNNIRHASWMLGSNYKNMEINSEGEIWVRQVGRKTYSLSEDTVLLGCVPKEAVNLLVLLERSPPSRVYKSPAVYDFDPNALPQVSVTNFISPEKFKKHLLFHLRPHLLDRSYLFSLSRGEFLETGLIRLEGVIIRMDPLPSDPAHPAFKGIVHEEDPEAPEVSAAKKSKGRGGTEARGGPQAQ
jgi:hypothetical protein